LLVLDVTAPDEPLLSVRSHPPVWRQDRQSPRWPACWSALVLPALAGV